MKRRTSSNFSWFACLATVGCAVAGSSHPTASSVILDELIGYYKVPSQACTGQDATLCRENADCLRIKSAGGHYRVELYSVQAYGHVCAFDLAMSASGGALKYADGEGREISVAKRGEDIVTTTNGFDPSPGFCGAHASFDGIAFPLASKQAQDRACFVDN